MATWSDIERNIDRLEELDRPTLEAYARVPPEPSSNPTYHQIYESAMRRIERALRDDQAEHKKSTIIAPIAVGVAIALLAGGSAPWWWTKAFPPAVPGLPFIKEKVNPKQPLAQQIRDGAEFQVVINNLRNPIGPIRNDFLLHGSYRQNGYQWTVWSAQHPARPNHRFIYGSPGDGKDIDEQGAPVNPMDHKRSLWGGVFTFDDAGNVYHPSQPGGAVGKLTITSPTTQ